MRTLEDKVVELVDHFEQLIGRYMMTEQQAPALCGGLFNRQEIKVIQTLGKQGPLSMHEIADHLTLAVSSTTSVVDKLVEKNIVSRERFEEDRRIVQVALTASGMELYVVAREGRMNVGRGMLGMLTEEEQDGLIDLFRKMTGGGADLRRAVTAHTADAPITAVS